MSHPSRSYTLKTSSARPTPCVPSTAIVRTLCVATAISCLRARARFLLCSVVGGASLLYLAAVVCAPKFPKLFLLSATFSISLLPYPRSCLDFVLATWVQPSHPASPRPSSVSGSNLVLTHRPLSSLPLSAAVLYCTVLYCTVLYASFDVTAVGTNSLTCGFNWQCTANVIGYAVMITARLDSLPSPQSLPRFRSTPAGTQPE